MTILHQQIKSALMPVMLEITEQARTAREKSKKPEDAVYRETEKAWGVLKTHFTDQINGALAGAKYMQNLLALVAAATNRPDLVRIAKANGSYAPVDPFTVLVLKEVPDNGHDGGFIVGLPYIVLHGIDKVMLGPDGRAWPNAFDQGGQHKTFVASDLEVEQCLEGLTPPQIRFIVGSELFAPYLDTMFDDSGEQPAPGVPKELQDLINPTEDDIPGF